jgi:hypothetical protein
VFWIQIKFNRVSKVAPESGSESKCWGKKSTNFKTLGTFKEFKSVLVNVSELDPDPH